MLDASPRNVIQSFQEMIYFMGLKLSVPAPSFSAKILVCQLSAHYDDATTIIKLNSV